MFGFTKKIFIGLLASIVSTSSHTKYVSLKDQKCGIQPTFINLHPSEYNHELQYYPFLVKLDRCFGNCNTLNKCKCNNVLCSKRNRRFKSKRFQHH